MCAHTSEQKVWWQTDVSRSAEDVPGTPLGVGSVELQRDRRQKSKEYKQQKRARKSYYTRYKVQAADASAKKIIIPGIEYKQQTRARKKNYTRHRVQASFTSLIFLLYQVLSTSSSHGPKNRYYTRYRVQAAATSPKIVVIPGIECNQQSNMQEGQFFFQISTVGLLLLEAAR